MDFLLKPPAGCAWFGQGSPQQPFCDPFVNVLKNPREVKTMTLPQVVCDKTSRGFRVIV